MSQAEKGELWKELKAAGVEFPLHYREYTTEQLRVAVQKLRGDAPQSEPEPEPVEKPEEPALAEAYEDFINAPAPEYNPEPTPQPEPVLQEADDFHTPALRHSDTPAEHAGIRYSTQSDDEPIRVDSDGLIWYQDEVRKPSMPTPRGRRVVKYNDPGVKSVTVPTGNGQTETFEMPGDDKRSMEARVTLPSYQVGIYRDPRMPMFRIHVYNEVRGFDLFDVIGFYGGSRELVPPEIEQVYVENSLCYDIRTTIRAIQAEYRERDLRGEFA